jgi:hypothetical protein
MLSRIVRNSLIAATLVLIAAPTLARAVTMAECSAKYKAAKEAGTLQGTTWNDFRKAQCGATATAAPASTTASGAPTKTPPATTTTTAATTGSAVGGAIFPSAIAPKYSKDSPGKARRETCLDQYHANMTANANGGLPWIEKGGGYYSECNKRLKGA